MLSMVKTMFNFVNRAFDFVKVFLVFVVVAFTNYRAEGTC